jgi:D-serine deaminase-like pyridoxal phosphate-dependent protein
LRQSCNLPKDKAELDTPALLVDIELLEDNIERISRTCRTHGVGWRPHVKPIKSPAIAKLLISAGAIGVTCAKLSEAEVMLDNGVSSILIANQIVGRTKISRLVERLRTSEIIVAVDSKRNVQMLDDMSLEAGVCAGVVIEVNTGMNRAGVASAAEVVDLALDIASRRGVCFLGLMTWESGAAAIPEMEAKRAAVFQRLDQLASCRKACELAGLPCEIVSCGGTGTYQVSAAYKGITEIQAGGGIFGDLYYATKCGLDHSFALTVLTSVTSRPTSTRIVCDAGRKAMSGELAFPQPVGLHNVKEVRLSAEHAIVELSEEQESFQVGDKFEFVVGYADLTVHLHDTIWGIRNGRVEAAWPVLGRGCLS